MSTTSILWLCFNLFVVTMLVLDLGVFHRKSHKVTVKEALVWTGVWIGLAFIFNTFIYYYFGPDKAYEFLTGYLIEKSLSVDNIFVFIMIFSFFSVPESLQHKVLFWGIAGALVMRVILILVGVELIHQFHWLIYIFGAFLIFTGVRFFKQDEVAINPENNAVVKLVRKIIPVTPDFVGNSFFTRVSGKLFATPLFVVMILIEVSDLIFAVDSIPAILAISDDSFIVYTSNVFAILGLRSLYFALAGIEKYFIYLKYGLAVVLIFIGVKMCIADLYHIPIEISLSFIVLTLGATMFFSMVLKKRS
ncbi:MAG: TerC family protein [Cyclobacteriaceae bacterium]|nr:TerC family protein [Cyclobacteriaceae bacterium]